MYGLKYNLLLSVFLLLTLPGLAVKAQLRDTMINVGNHNLHFTLMEGKGIPIVFESGAGNDASVWRKLLEPLSSKLGAPLITYDRAGFGKSEIDTVNISLTNEVKDLKTALQQLGYRDRYFFVAHSFGGNYTMKFITTHPGQVVGTVMIDIVSPYLMTMERSKSLKSEYASELDHIKKESLGFYHLVLNYEASTAVLHEVAGKINVPMTVIGSGKSPFEEPDRSLFIAALKKFADQKNNRRYLLAQNAEHHVFYDEPDLVIDEIVKLYQKTAFE
ncbi:alpha/beta fold hydrolase [Sphingobacterium multivorum]|uniref:alpha/beta fold hydrolase n=1 Tax=Sphingobacterium multivorum TaxID=28454 RepID=UPI0031BAA701